MRYCILVSTLFLTTASLAQNSKTCENNLAINWVLPGNFADALKQANDQQRLILIKGIAFGIDDLGATSATKGCW